MRWLAVLILVPASLAGLLWLTLAWWIQPAAQAWLNGQGLQLQTLEAARPGWRQWHVATVLARHPETGATLVVRNIQVDWQPLELMRRGTLEQVHIDQLDVSIITPTSLMQPAAPPSRDPGLDPRQYLADALATLPIDNLRLDTLEARLSSKGEDGTRRLALAATDVRWQRPPGLLTLDNLTLEAAASPGEPGLTFDARLQGQLTAKPLAYRYHLRLFDPEFLLTWNDADNSLRLQSSRSQQTDLHLNQQGLVMAAPLQAQVEARQQAQGVSAAADLELTVLELKWPPGASIASMDASLTGTGRSQWLRGHAEVGFTLPVQLSLAGDAARLTLQPHLTSALLQHEDWQVSELELTLPAALDPTLEHLVIEAGAHLRATAVSTGDQGLQDIRATLLTATSLSGLPARPALDNATLRLNAETMITADRQTDVADLQLQLTLRDLLDTGARQADWLLYDSTGLHASGQLLTTAPGHSLVLDEAEIPLGAGLLQRVWGDAWPGRSGTLQVQGAVTGTSLQDWEADLTARLDQVGLDWQALRLRELNAVGQLKASPGRLALALEHAQAGELGYTIADEPLQLIGPSLAGQVQVDLRADRVAGSLRAEAPRASRAGMQARLLQASADLRGSWRAPDVQGRLQGASFDIGFPATELDCGFHLPASARLELENCELNALGGALRLGAGHFTWTTGDGYLPLAVDGVELNAVLALMQDPGLSGTGLLSGSLPLSLRDGTASVHEGWVAARHPGGTLHYIAAPEQLAAMTQPQLQLAFSALADLRYERLTSRIDYQEGGELVLGISVRGRSPELEDGRPVELNLNVTQNLLTLLRSLQFADQIDAEIRRRLQGREPETDP